MRNLAIIYLYGWNFLLMTIATKNWLQNEGEGVDTFAMCLAICGFVCAVALT